MILIRTVSETEAQNGYLNRTVDTLIRFTTMLHTPSTLQRWRQHLRYIYISLFFSGFYWRFGALVTGQPAGDDEWWRTRNRVASHFIGERSQPLALTLASARVKTKTKTKQKGQGEESRFGLTLPPTKAVASLSAPSVRSRPYLSPALCLCLCPVFLMWCLCVEVFFLLIPTLCPP